MSTRALRDAATAFGRARDVYDGPGMMGGSAMAAAAYDAAAKTLRHAATPEALLEILNENARLRRELEEAQVRVVDLAENLQGAVERAERAEAAYDAVNAGAATALRQRDAEIRTLTESKTRSERMNDEDTDRLLHSLKAERTHRETQTETDAALVRMKMTACAVLVWACDSRPNVDSVERAVNALAAHAEKLSDELTRVAPTTEELYTLIRVCDQWIPRHVSKDEHTLRAWIQRIEGVRRG